MIFVGNFKANAIKFCLLTALFLFALLSSLVPFIIRERKIQLNQRHVRFAPDLKYILFWNHPKVKKFKSFHVKAVSEFEIGQSSFIKQNCPHINCYISYNASLLDGDQSNFDAVVFDVHDISRFKVNYFNFTRSPSQRFIFRSHESSDNQPVCNPVFDNFFNWTWTYKLNSDIPHPFLNIYDSNNMLVGPKINMTWIKTMKHSTVARNKFKFKDRAVIWIINKCRLKHKFQDFVHELRQELKAYNHTIDTFGSCGDNKCPSSKLNECYKLAERDYYFQLVLEESTVEDYITEGIGKALNLFTVPIVLGDADFRRFIPPGSYVNVRAFDIKKLGALVDYLIKTPKVYRYFFDWKNHYYYATKHRTDVCDLCTKLNANERETHKNYANFRHWWSYEYKDICERMHLYETVKGELGTGLEVMNRGTVQTCVRPGGGSP
ncbi:unnamed protein product [Chilo suppressalis]|uniref:Fucosyltransferase n=1 Tax=Chilo suppressalis TaxID=168631 RepID=A0ABN8AVQ0_CHISP|nr:unnamed protein product [Chilo suppressalis]